MSPEEIAGHLNIDIERLAALIGVTEQEILSISSGQNYLPMAVLNRFRALEELVRNRTAKSRCPE